LAKRKRLGELYRRELSGLSKLKLLYLDPQNTPNYQIFPVHIKNRLDFARFMRDHGIFVNVNNRRNDRYSIFGKKQNLPVLKKVDEDTILIPIHSNLTDRDMEKIISTIKKYDKA
jgi:dTDP-4-amino-4,6-dideoxygalactose transaminase